MPSPSNSMSFASLSPAGAKIWIPDGLKSLNGTSVRPEAIGGKGGNVRRGSGAGGAGGPVDMVVQEKESGLCSK